MSDGVSVQILRNAGRDKQQRVNDAGGQKDIEQRPCGVDPEVADGVGSGALDATDERHRHHDAHRRRPEVVRRQPSHLREIAHGGFRRVELPVGVGCELAPVLKAKSVPTLAR